MSMSFLFVCLCVWCCGGVLFFFFNLNEICGPKKLFRIMILVNTVVGHGQ